MPSPFTRQLLRWSTLPPSAPTPARLAAALEALSGGGGASILYAKDNGGKQLRDSTGVLSTDAQGFYLSRSTGERLRVDADIAEGGTVGVPRMYTAHGVTVGTVTGLPATGRRTGFAPSAGNYAGASFDTRQYTLIARVNFDGSNFGTQETLFISGQPGAKAQCYGAGAFLVLRVWDGAAARAQVTVSVSTIGSGWRWVVATVDALTAGTTYLGVYNDAGDTLLGSATNTDAAAIVDTANAYTLGAMPGGAGDLPWLQGISDVLGLDGGALSASACADIVADLGAGTTTIDDYGDTWSLPTDGLVTGVYDESDGTILIYETGSGASVTAEYP